MLSNIQSSFPELLTLALRLIGLHRRNGDLERVKQLYEKFLAEVSSSSSSKDNTTFFAVKYARFLSKTVKSYEKVGGGELGGKVGLVVSLESSTTVVVWNRPWIRFDNLESFFF